MNGVSRCQATTLLILPPSDGLVAFAGLCGKGAEPHYALPRAQKPGLA